ncbi:MAG: hypothetical protein ACYDIE_12895 [Candidatus Krumholzibacteriia bacterium]
MTALELARLSNCARTPACAAAPLCESCAKAVSFQHPDIRWIGPAPASLGEAETAELMAAKREDCFYQPPFAASSDVTIGAVDDPGPLTVRALLRFLRLQAFQGRFKAAIVLNAHRFTAEAANAFLKTLEEPPPNALILLLTANRAAMLPTLVSRCQPVRFEPYPEEELAALLVARGEAPARAAALARAADGSVRKALALRGPEVAAVYVWAGELLERIHAGAVSSAYVAAEMLHKGTVPDGVDDDGTPLPAPPVAADLAERRERALQLCEMMNLYYGDLLACRERGADWRPRRSAQAVRLRELAGRRSSRGLLDDIARIERAKGEIDRNLNLGLTMAALLQGLVSNAEQDRAAAGR